MAWVGREWKEAWKTLPAEERNSGYVVFVLIKTLRNTNIAFPLLPHHRRAVISHIWNLGRARPHLRTRPDSIYALGEGK